MFKESLRGAVALSHFFLNERVKPGDRVVRSGMFKLRNGLRVLINNDIVPPTDLAPKPANS